MRRALAVLVFLSFATAAFASPDDAPPRVELPLGPYVRPGRPVDVRVIGGADRVRAPGTPWALPVGARGDEFLLQIPAAIAAPLDLTVERGGRTDRVTVAATVLPGDRQVFALPNGVSAPEGALGVPVTEPAAAPVKEAWLLFDRRPSADALDPRMPGSLHQPARDSPWETIEPFTLPPEPELFRVLDETAAAAPLLDGRTATLLSLLAATEVALALVLAYRRDRPWIRAAWLAAPAAAVVAALGPSASVAPLVAEPLALGDGAHVVFVRIRALRDGSGTLVLPDAATSPFAAVRFAVDDRSAEEMSVGREVRVSLRAGESRVVAYRGLHGDVGEDATVPGTAAGEPRPAAAAWLRSRGLLPLAETAGVARALLPSSSDVRVLPGIGLRIAALPTK
jgi:hypothetical protein